MFRKSMSEMINKYQCSWKYTLYRKLWCLIYRPCRSACNIYITITAFWNTVHITVSLKEGAIWSSNKHKIHQQIATTIIEMKNNCWWFGQGEGNIQVKLTFVNKKCIMLDIRENDCYLNSMSCPSVCCSQRPSEVTTTWRINMHGLLADFFILPQCH